MRSEEAVRPLFTWPKTTAFLGKNVMVTPNGDLKLIDFGIARFFKPGQTHNTVKLGTPGYAPCQSRRLCRRN